MFRGRATMAASQSFSMIQRRMLLSPCPASPVKRGTVVDFGEAAAEPGLVFHFREHVGQENHLSVAGAGEEGVLRFTSVLGDEAGILDSIFAAHALQVALPTFPIGRVREHEVELARWEGIVEAIPKFVI
jgi:hypothetical protein